MRLNTTIKLRLRLDYVSSLISVLWNFPQIGTSGSRWLLECQCSLVWQYNINPSRAAFGLDYKCRNVAGRPGDANLNLILKRKLAQFCGLFWAFSNTGTDLREATAQMKCFSVAFKWESSFPVFFVVSRLCIIWLHGYILEVFRNKKGRLCYHQQMTTA